jgi:hypothetical protein
VAVVIDCRKNRGAIFVHEISGGKYIEGVGTEDAGNLVIFPWNHEWYGITLRLGLCDLPISQRRTESRCRVSYITCGRCAASISLVSREIWIVMNDDDCVSYGTVSHIATFDIDTFNKS